ncbi:MAG TPA: zinc ribbon domain-containing protein [Clostridiales bacterium]|nr:zinc ribbon domain-containing protein [Clostridiales bacterium]
MAYCSNCGVKLSENDKFCKECGAPVSVQDAIKEKPAADGQSLPEAAAQEAVAADTAVPAAALVFPAKKYFSRKKFFIFAGSAFGGVLLLSLIITIVAVAGSDRSFTMRDLFDHYEYDYGYDYDYDYGYDDYDYDYDYDYDAEGGYYGGTYYGDFFYAEIPDSWMGHYECDESYDAVTFYNTENDMAGYGGLLLSICRYAPGDDYQSIPNYQILSETDAYTYVAVYPSDVQYNYEDTALTSLYQEMTADAEITLLTSIVFY